MRMWKIACLVFSLLLIFSGWLGYSYFGFQVKFNEKISAGELSAAESILDRWEKTIGCHLLKNISRFKQDFAFQKGWLLSQRGDYAAAIREFQLSSLYNSATLSLVESLTGGGRESLEKLAGDYVQVLTDAPDDFQAKVNLEIVHILQEQAKQQMKSDSSEQGEGEKKEKKKMRKFRPGDEDSKGSSAPGNQGFRY